MHNDARFWWYSLTLIVCLAVGPGCGSAADSTGAPGTASAAATGGGGTASGAPATGAPAVGAAAKAPPIAEPTAEEIARWTPAPFEPVQLLAAREWKKTSFSGSVAATPDGKHFIVAGSRVLLWGLTGDEPEHVFLELTADDGDRSILTLAVAPNGKWFAVGDSNGMVRIWNLDDRKEVIAKKLNSNAVTELAISPDSQEIAAIGYDSEVTTWSADGLKPLKSFKVDTNGIKRIAYLAPGMLAAAGETTTLWNTATGEKVRELSPGRYSFALARSADGSRFLFGGDESLTIWDVSPSDAAQSKVEVEIKKQVSGSELVAISPDGKTLTTSNGRGFRLWNLAERRVGQVVDGFGETIVGLAWLPETNLLAVASEGGCTRIWGTAAAGAAAGLAPLHKPVAMPAADSREPADPLQMAEMIDLRTFPVMPGSEPNMVGAGDYGAVVPASAAEAMTFYSYFLRKLGWTATAVAPPNPSIEFRKNGFLIVASFYDAGGGAGEGKTNVSVHHEGNYDARWTPKFDAAPTEASYEGFGTVSYRTKASLLEVETALMRKLHAAGWAAYTRLHSSHSEEPDARDFEWVRNGMTLRVSIGKFPVDPASYTITYSMFPIECAAPIPADAGFVEFDGSTEPSLVAITKMTFDEATKFYDDAMTAQGWLVREHGRSEKEDRAWLSYLRNQSDLTVGLTKLDDGRTLVRIGDTGGSLWELSQPKDKPDDKAEAEATEVVGLQAADLPVLNATKTATYDAIGESIEVRIEGSTLGAVAERYTAALAELGWKAGEGGIRDEEYTMIDFAKGEKEFTLRARKQEGAALVSFRGDGLLWTKELPGGKKVVSFETWLRLNKRPPEFGLLEQYETEMRAIGAP